MHFFVAVSITPADEQIHRFFDDEMNFVFVCPAN